MDALRMQELQTDAARTLLEVVQSEGAAEGDLLWSTIGRNSMGILWLIGEDGNERIGRVPSTLFKILPPLREAMYQDGKGAWLSARVRVRADGQNKMNFDYERRPYWHKGGSPYEAPADPALIAPGDVEFVDDLRRFPRAPEFLPEWYPSVDAPSGSGLGERSLEVQDVVNMTPVLLEDPGWRLITDVIRTSMATAVDRLDAAVALADASERESICSSVGQQAIGLAMGFAPERQEGSLDAAVIAGLTAPRTTRPTGEQLLEDLGDAISTVVDDRYTRVTDALT